MLNPNSQVVIAFRMAVQQRWIFAIITPKYKKEVYIVEHKTQKGEKRGLVKKIFFDYCH